jgi:hypothetical protein
LPRKRSPTWATASVSDWLRLLRCENIGPRTFNVLLSRHGSAGAALAALPALIASGKPGRPIRIATVEETEREIEAAQRLGARFIGIGEPDYPALLRRTASAPPLIAVRGNLSSLRRSKIAIVGARNASAAGLAFTSQLARGIARAGQKRGFALTCSSLTASNNLLKKNVLGLLTFALVCYDLPKVVSYLFASKRRADKGNVHDGPKINQSKRRAHPCTGPNDLGLQSKGLRRPKAKGIGRLLHPRFTGRRRAGNVGTRLDGTVHLGRQTWLARKRYAFFGKSSPAEIRRPRDRPARPRPSTIYAINICRMRDPGGCLCAEALQKRRQHS